ncbi:Gfo/Idh/MocA family protein [Yinghuangia soli]|uniref:Gfo/Idh/MocA family oxidoreductase n=1 Tax=Yinghuangia soli TaxID=2908204 RepID=A0AA41Q7P6_9ACTN|nr:Gfo/Idh/MocA family oxidoreductase [Yinghuangia soli]MCF2533134.1 Gfo/Idh/MocA family oxidoreductase [Yinghuangia soli]
MIRVGVVGASGWADGSHLPALTGLPEYKVTAVATTNQASADRVAAAHGVRHAFADAAELVAHPDVDLVVVSVRVTGHAAVIRAALDAGKHVVSEWPLAVDEREARELAEAAAASGVHHAVVLQGRHSASAAFAADLLAEGRIGTLQSAALIAAGDPFGGSSIPAELAWSLDPAAGNSILTIMAGHFLATLERVAGRFTEVSARLPRVHERVRIGDTDRTEANATPDQVLVHGLLEGGATASVTIHGGNGRTPDGFLLKLAGSTGTLTATPAEPGSFIHWSDWEIRVDGELLAVPESYRTIPAGIPAGPPANIAALYREVAAALTEQRRPEPDFAAGLRHHRLLAAIERAAATTAPQQVP